MREPRDEDVSEWLLKGDRRALTLALGRSVSEDTKEGNGDVAKLCVPDFSNLLCVAALRKGHWHVPALAKRAHPAEVDLSRWSTCELTVVVLLQVAHLKGMMPDWPCACLPESRSKVDYASLALTCNGLALERLQLSGDCLSCPLVCVTVGLLLTTGLCE